MMPCHLRGQSPCTKGTLPVADIFDRFRQFEEEMMFKVKNIYTGEIFTVYGINGAYFLIWNENAEEPCWEWSAMAHLAPVQEVAQ